MSQFDSPSAGPTADGAHDADDGRLPSWSTIRQKLWGLSLRAGAWLGAFCLFGLLLTGGAGWYTSRPQFCNSCHIMEPYYVSWQESTHKDVSCIKCHFPPGVGEKVRGKLLGLVQLAQYVTRSAGPSPSAEIPDASCLRSGCHETRLLSGRVDFQGIPFDHGSHLGDLRRGKQLRCTSCHSQIVQGAHMTVTASTCYLCHFKNGFFNEGLGTCTRCHQIPTSKYDLGGGVPFDHDLAFEKGVDCASCHADLIRGNGEVPAERCSVCHNRKDDLEQIKNDAFIHRVHVSEHNVDCLSCHLQIHHTLDPHQVAQSAANCVSCHPNQHEPQVQLLTGSGGHSIAARLSGMAAVRIACPTCHRVKDVSSTGAVLMKASLQTCASCHDAAEVTLFDAYHLQLKESLTQLAPETERIRASLDAAGLPTEQRSTLAAKLTAAEHDLKLLQAGNDIHNSHYASALAEAVVTQLAEISKELQIEAPTVTLPEKPVRTPGEKPAEAPAESAPPVEPPVPAEPAPAESMPAEPATAEQMPVEPAAPIPPAEAPPPAEPTLPGAAPEKTDAGAPPAMESGAPGSDAPESPAVPAKSPGSN
jgi:nitrate/TMAO reductase-like tetraheme cytochrome c subunit